MNLQRSQNDRMLTGVCGGIAEATNVDPTLVRIISAAVILLTGVGPILYILAWLLMPEANGHTVAQDATNWLNSKNKPGHSGAGQPYPDPHAGRQSEPEGLHNPHDLR